VPAEHEPAPSHEEAAIAFPSAQSAGKQVVSPAGKVQAARPAPSQLPWQAPMPAQAGRPPPGAPVAGTQLPAWPGSLHASHCPPQALSQQTESTQKPLAHWVAPPHDVPVASLAWQVPLAQKSPATQSASCVQSPLHAVAPHTNGEQLTTRSAGQCP
jgi:hypothetical protein